MNNLFRFGFWFNSSPGELSTIGQNIYNVLLILFAALMVIGFVYKRRKGNWKFVWKRLFSFSTLNFILFLIYFFFIYENVPFFSSRFWFIILLVEIGFWIYFIIKDFREIPILKKETEKKKEFEKYLP